MKPYSNAIRRLKSIGLRPTRQRMALAKILFENGDRHVNAEGLHAEALNAGVRLSLATVYNTLHQFTEVGLMREIVVEPSRSYFDTNVTDHHHFYFEDTGRMEDIPKGDLTVSSLPTPPEGCAIKSVDVVVRLQETPQ
jgi:Fur family transcriptional regulator, iron response regulator